MGRFQALSHEKSPQTLAWRREKQLQGANMNEVSDSLMLCEGMQLTGALEAFFNQTFELL